MSLTQKPWKNTSGSLAPAMPPDVRRGYAPPSTLPDKSGYADGSGSAHTMGLAQLKNWFVGGAKPRLTSGGVAGARVRNVAQQSDDFWEE